MTDSERTLWRYIGERVSVARRTKHITQATLADELDLSRASVVNMECGNQAWPLFRLYEVAAVLETSVTCLLPTDAELISLLLLAK